MCFYLVRKLFATIPTLVGVTLLVFFCFHVAGGDPAFVIAGKHASAAQLLEVRHQHGFDLPYDQQYFRFLKEVATLDFGTSQGTHQPVGLLIGNAIAPTLTLILPAFILSTFLSVIIALWTASSRGHWVEKFVIVGCIFGMSVPMLAYILLGQHFFAYRLGWFPIHGYEHGFPEQLYSVALPVLIWIVVNLGYDVRYYRTAIIEETAQDYVRTARAKGLPEAWIFFKHVLKNSFPPIITHVLTEIPLLITATFLLEGFFGIPGIGGIMIEALKNSDFQVLKALTVYQAIVMVFANAATDVLYSWVDPRMGIS